MKRRPLLKNRANQKGIALESAILFMTFTFSFCCLLTSLALWGYGQLRAEDAYMKVYVEKEQIGEHFVVYLNEAVIEAETGAGQGSGNFMTFLAENNIVYENYTCEEIRTQDADRTQFELVVRRGSGDDAAVVLYIQAEKTEAGQVNILSWLNTLPETDEA